MSNIVIQASYTIQRENQKYITNLLSIEISGIKHSLINIKKKNINI